MAPEIVVIGSSNTDMILRLDHLPAPGETVLGGQFVTAAGGKGANQAVAAARAGGQVTFLGRVGADALGRQAIAGLREAGIAVDQVVVDETEPTGVALIFVGGDGENCIGVASGANAQLTPDDVRRQSARIAAAELLVLQLEIPLPSVAVAVELAAATGVPVILNPAPAQTLNDHLLTQVNLLTPNRSEAARLTGLPVDDLSAVARAAEQLRHRGVGHVLVTLGSEGVWVSSPEFEGHVPAFPVTPVDSTAAGDVFNGALAVAFAERRSLSECVQFASAAAACSVTRLGAQPSAPARDEIEQRLVGSSGTRGNR